MSMVSPVFGCITYVSRVFVHRADTEERNCRLTAASFAILAPIPPKSLHFSFHGILHVSFGLSLILFPAGVLRIAAIGIDIRGILLTKKHAQSTSIFSYSVLK